VLVFYLSFLPICTKVFFLSLVYPVLVSAFYDHAVFLSLLSIISYIPACASSFFFLISVH